LDPSSLERQAGRIEAIADLSAFPERALEVELLRARVAVLLANVLAILGRNSVAHAKRALRIAKRLRISPDLAPGAADGVVAESYLAQCNQASSTAKRALYHHQGRAAAWRALAADADEVSANFALGAFALYTPVAFGGSFRQAIPHLERAVHAEPLHAGARWVLTQAYQRAGRQAEYTASLARLWREAPGLAERLSADPPPRERTADA
jgi:hypothetical protein